MIIPSERSVPPVPWALLLGLLVLLAAFGSLGEEVWVHGGFLWEKALLLGLHAHASPALDGLMSGVTFVGGPKVMLPLALDPVHDLGGVAQSPPARLTAFSTRLAGGADRRRGGSHQLPDQTDLPPGPSTPLAVPYT